MNEEQIKAVKEFLKEVHGLSETQIGKHFASTETAKEFSEIAKGKNSDSYDEGLEDGKTKLTKTLITSLKKELGIEFPEKNLKRVEDLGKVLKPIIEEKFKADGNTESEAVKEWKQKYETALADRDKEVLEAKNSAKNEVEGLRRDSLAREILKTEGYNVPEDTTAYQIKLDMVKSMIEKRGYNYEVDQKDGLHYRMKEDGTKERSGNKTVTFNDDFKSLADVAFGKTPAESKGGGLDKGLGTGGAGGTTDTKFDWSKVESKNFTQPANKDEARKQMINPLVPLADRGILRDFINHLETEEKATTA